MDTDANLTSGEADLSEAKARAFEDDPGDSADGFVDEKPGRSTLSWRLRTNTRANRSGSSKVCECGGCPNSDPDYDDERCARAMEQMFDRVETHDGYDVHQAYEFIHDSINSIKSAPTHALHSIRRSFNKFIDLEPHSDIALEIQRIQIIATWRELMTSDLWLKAMAAEGVASANVSNDDYEWPLKVVIDKQDVRAQLLRALQQDEPGYSVKNNPVWNEMKASIDSANPEVVIFELLNGAWATLKVFDKLPLNKYVIQATGILEALELAQNHRCREVQDEVDELVVEWRTLVQASTSPTSTRSEQGARHPSDSSDCAQQNHSRYHSDDKSPTGVWNMKDKHPAPSASLASELESYY
ncbi:hypothetical protein CC86DRAFT_407111 [Ophiobolus disseminans]|uniref:Uncharacterized protein n=1 Tax=Ophiobolus disseminans TaxID=1469910 RepID=A0A6A6ZXS9_9PLEO|nr:hypothetical protein CC86DRAFT_407111 [Ophiobolus disseminans]